VGLREGFRSSLKIIRNWACVSATSLRICELAPIRVQSICGSRKGYLYDNVNTVSTRRGIVGFAYCSDGERSARLENIGLF
jgi:hypothetical protein